jgi:F-type H+-transporting ATPase subunit b
VLDFSVTFIITIINITILFLILRKILFKPVTKFMEDRSRSVQESIDQANKDRTDAKKLLADYEGKLKDADSEAQKIIKDAHTQAAQQSEQIIAEGKKEAENIIAAAHKHIEAEHQVALAKFKIEAAALVIAATSKLATREVSGDDNRRYVNMLLEELSQQSSAFRKGNK